MSSRISSVLNLPRDRSPHTHRSTQALILGLGLMLALSPTVAAEGDGSPPCSPPERLAAQLFDGEIPWDTLPLEASYQLDDEILEAEGRLQAQVDTRLGESALERLRSARPVLCVALVLEAEGDLPVIHQQRISTDLSGAVGWRAVFSADLSETTSQLLVIVEEPASRRLGAALADEGMFDSEPPGPQAVHSEASWHEPLLPKSSGQVDRSSEVVVRLIPPRSEPAQGPTRIDALVTTDAVDRVVFTLDGQEVADRGRRPFATRVPLDTPARPQVVEAIAFDREGRELGRDIFEVNRSDAPFRARIEAIDGDPASGQIEVGGRVDVPFGSTLDRVELYLGERLVGRFTEPEVRARIDTSGVGPDAFVRLAALLTDGSSIDDVALLSAPGLVEEVEVNLVELFTVVTDGEGHPVEGLGAEDFEIVFEGRRQAPQSFAYADDVSLLVGLVVDTSGSMELVMHDTRKAAAKFLGSTVLPQDSAFLVDFDAAPRLLHPTTDDLPALLRDLSRLEAGGATAMYDAVTFSMLQFEHYRGRKALVVLTDGDDYESRFTPKDCAELAQRTGVPIYVIGLGQLDILRRTYSKRDLRRVTEGTGGRLYFVDTLDQLDAAYAQIQAELRSQYVLAFYADRDLDTAERRSVKVEVVQPGLEARTVVGSRRSP